MERAEKRPQAINSHLLSAVSTKSKQVAFADDLEMNSTDPEPANGYGKAGHKIQFNQLLTHRDAPNSA